MSKSSSPPEFVVTVPSEGAFTFRKRNMRTQMAIECEFARLTEGLEDIPNFLAEVASKMADLKALAVTVPDGWDVDEMDPEDPADFARMNKVWSALRDKEASFRQRPRVEAAGAGDGGDGGTVVPPSVQPSAN